jgi:hypothetical protein
MRNVPGYSWPLARLARLQTRSKKDLVVWELIRQKEVISVWPLPGECDHFIHTLIYLYSPKHMYTEINK